jgi:citrate synthase
MESPDELFEIVSRCHIESTFRNNPSSLAVKMAAQSSGKFINAVTAALSMLGNPHGPVQEVTEMLDSEDPIAFAKMYIDNGAKVPGWGNGFVKGKPDPAWNEAHEYIKENFSDMFSLVDEITKLLHDDGKMIYPNPACYTAITAIVNYIPADAASYIFISSRLPAWFDIYMKERNK